MRKMLYAFALVLLASSPALARDYSLANGEIHFNAPDNWVAMMQKTNGNLQFYAFQVPNPAPGNKLTHITVTTHQLENVGDFEAFVRQQQSQLESKPAFEKLGGQLTSSEGMQYRFNQDLFPQVARLRIMQHGRIAIELRCQRPWDLGAGDNWLQDFRAHCQDLASQLGV